VARERGCLFLGFVWLVPASKKASRVFSPFRCIAYSTGLTLERTCWLRASLLLFPGAPSICQQVFIDICFTASFCEEVFAVTRLLLLREIYLTRPDPRALALRRQPRARTTLQPIGLA
jgi:hypothetical protein